MGTYKVKPGCGSHSVKGKDYGPGQAFECKDNLVQLFPGRFELVTEGYVKPDLEADEDGFGEDITSKFKGAEELGATVYRNGNEYFIHIDGEIHDAGAQLLNQRMVKEALKAYEATLEEDEDEDEDED